jgi:hypothetical protein
MYYRQRSGMRQRGGMRMYVQEYSTYLSTVQVFKSPPTYRVRRGEGNIQGGEGRITTPIWCRNAKYCTFFGNENQKTQHF